LSFVHELFGIVRVLVVEGVKHEVFLVHWLLFWSRLPFFLFPLALVVVADVIGLHPLIQDVHLVPIGGGLDA